MPSATSRLGLIRPLAADAHSQQVVYDALTTLDQYPGIYIAANAAAITALTWGAPQIGMTILQADEGTLWRWIGSAAVRLMPQGLLGSSQVTSDFSTPSTTPQTVISCATVIPRTTTGSTKKRIRVVASFYALDNSLQQCEVSLYRSSGAVLLKTFRWTGGPSSGAAGSWGPGGTIEAYDAPPVAGGAFTYILRVCSLASPGGTTIMRASASNPASLEVDEVSV